MTAALVIRPARQSDRPWLLEQLAQFDREASSPVRHFPADIADADALLASYIDAGPFFVAARDADGPRLGFINGFLVPSPFNASQTWLVERFWWVEHEYRLTRAGSALLAAYHAYGDAHADACVMTLEVDSPVKPETLARYGYALSELSFTRATARGRGERQQPEPFRSHCRSKGTPSALTSSQVPPLALPACSAPAAVAS